MQSPRRLSRWQWALLLIGIATALGLFFATKFYYGWRAAGYTGYQVTWTKHLWWQAMEWYTWAAFAPLIFLVCRKAQKWRRAQLIFALLAAGALFAAAHVLILTVGARIEAAVRQTGFTWSRLAAITFRNHFHSDLFTYGAIVVTWIALDYHSRLRDRERAAADLEARLSEARLQSLRSQIQPHFLFNTLNTIASLNHDDPKAANRMLAQLSQLLRVSLESDARQDVTLEQELAFLKGYLEIEQARFGDRLGVIFDIAPETLTAQVPNLLLQPLVENAVRHGIAPYARPGEVRIAARKVSDRLKIEISDTGPGIERVAKNGGQGNGIGLINTQARLQQLYGDKQSFKARDGAKGGTVVEVTIPLHCRPNHSVEHDKDQHSHC